MVSLLMLHKQNIKVTISYSSIRFQCCLGNAIFSRLTPHPVSLRQTSLGRGHACQANGMG